MVNFFRTLLGVSPIIRSFSSRPIIMGSLVCNGRLRAGLGSLLDRPLGNEAGSALEKGVVGQALWTLHLTLRVTRLASLGCLPTQAGLVHCRQAERLPYKFFAIARPLNVSGTPVSNSRTLYLLLGHGLEALATFYRACFRWGVAADCVPWNRTRSSKKRLKKPARS